MAFLVLVLLVINAWVSYSSDSSSNKSTVPEIIFLNEYI